MFFKQIMKHTAKPKPTIGILTPDRNTILDELAAINVAYFNQLGIPNY